MKDAGKLGVSAKPGKVMDMKDAGVKAKVQGAFGADPKLGPGGFEGDKGLLGKEDLKGMGGPGGMSGKDMVDDMLGGKDKGEGKFGSGPSGTSAGASGAGLGKKDQKAGDAAFGGGKKDGKSDGKSDGGYGGFGGKKDTADSGKKDSGKDTGKKDSGKDSGKKDSGGKKDSAGKKDSSTESKDTAEKDKGDKDKSGGDPIGPDPGPDGWDSAGSDPLGLNPQNRNREQSNMPDMGAVGVNQGEGDRAGSSTSSVDPQVSIDARINPDNPDQTYETRQEGPGMLEQLQTYGVDPPAEGAGAMEEPPR
jgi:hypothetical protein